MEDEFDDRTYANNIIQGRAISDALARLADGINLLDKELHSQVRLPSCRFLRLIIMLKVVKVHVVVTEQGTIAIAIASCRISQHPQDLDFKCEFGYLYITATTVHKHPL